jgi:hypothetical protein
MQLKLKYQICAIWSQSYDRCIYIYKSGFVVGRAFLKVPRPGIELTGIELTGIEFYNIDQGSKEQGSNYLRIET